MTKIFPISCVILFCCIWNNVDAQIYSQGKNINNLKAFSINVELNSKPLDPSKYHAKIDFYGKKKGLEYYLKEGVEHKSFNDDKDLIAYLENNGWFFVKKESIKARSNGKERVKYFFRKSMKSLSEEQELSTKNSTTQD